ncbi:hypothetical protein CASFOL_006228 [Castilleja foliolosa]|uniref:RRM domain-containing protein n=1 Tax=Castilleja foliolosa TaxID=1961234 RepID=A0ABD3E9Q3_9LAMI
MNQPDYSRFPAHHLDPGAQEFFPTAALPSPPPQIYYPFPPPPPSYDHMGYARPQFLLPTPYASAAAEPPPQQIAHPPPSSPPPSRTLLLSMVPASVSESAVRRELEVFGDVRAVQMERRREGLVTVHFYDVRDAQAALAAIQEQHMQQQYRLGLHYEAVLNIPPPFAAVAPPPPPLPPQMARGLIQGRVVWAQFATPVTTGIPDGNNQGTLVIFNLAPVISTAYLRDIFEAFGPVKELRETPYKRNQRFVEFYDVRNAAKAMSEMNGKQIYGNKTIVIEYSRPGGHSKKFPKCPPISSKLSYSPSTRPENSKTTTISRKGVNPSGSDRSWSSGSSVQESMTNLSIASKKNNNNNTNNNTSDDGGGGCGRGGSKGGGNRPWKFGGIGRRGKDHHDPRFLIKEDAIVLDESNNCRDPRTTVMIKNMPNKYSQKLLLNMLDNHCIHCNEQIAKGEEEQPLSSYDFVYLPIDFINKCNVGYGFVNMTSPQATLRLYKAFHNQSWEVFNSRKICDVTYARLQGLEALREHFKNSKFPDDSEASSMPVVFTPPRDGLLLSDPVPIVGRAFESSPSSSTSSKECQLVEP